MSGYEVVHRPHACPKPKEPMPVGTVIRCIECGRKHTLTWFGGWLPERESS